MDSCAVNNVTNNERTFRGVLAIGMLTAAITGIVTSPMAIFSILIAVYLIMTATLGSDPIYTAAHAMKIDT
jgi:ethanolamine transporter EutH